MKSKRTRNLFRPEAPMLRKLPILAFLLAFALPFAHADEASKRTKIQELFVVMKLNALMDQVLKSGMAQGEQMGRNMFGDKPIAPEDQKILDNWNLKVTAFMQENLSWEKLRPAYTDLYAATYSEEDIDGILAFYKSTAGQHMVEKTPGLVTASQKIVMTRMQGVQTQLQDLMKDLMAQLKAAHPDMAAPQNQ